MTYVLAGDIGGTRARFAVFEVNEAPRLVHQDVLDSRAYRTFADALGEFLDVRLASALGRDVAIEAATLGIAGPVIHQRVKATNLPWVVDGAAIAVCLKRLTTAEMVQISGPWTKNGSDARKAIQKAPELAGILPRIDAAHATLLAARPVPDDPRLAAIVNDAAELDARHDALVRGVDLVLEGIALLVGPGSRTEEIDATRAILTPDGLGVVSTSYRNEAGAAALLKSRLPQETTARAVLQSVTVDKKTALGAFVNTGGTSRRSTRRAKPTSAPCHEPGRQEASCSAARRPRTPVCLRGGARAWCSRSATIDRAWYRPRHGDSALRFR